MKTLTIILIGMVVLSIFTMGYYFVLDKMNYGIPKHNRIY
jgi:hypothetical protein